ncbi:hypothetical protein GUITHDRAFT_116250 [Guillardia theta CCMP2712]|uniref:Uncharacterized protein n=1 Tax=Guillardia theta (strain CCMP2712) TaxID=905079 RepID=L1INY9_GUITC|nr:hypothetical protein GUITHDRAFT_116250 [Guillardia theta CCMP2712]EKX37609.1 hypothetical protein GUITHDRAFT_116250 [Guillardia theta CCMP2712]|eukprot:XP_005824589.1 hypothetical protein GUITHDRAFT_116250 [Guillardia theta CCMP2712]
MHLPSLKRPEDTHAEDVSAEKEHGGKLCRPGSALGTCVSTWPGMESEGLKKQESVNRKSLKLRGGSEASGQIIQCHYQSDWDNNGVLWVLGRMAAMHSGAPPDIPWINPGSAGLVRIHCGERGYQYYDLENFDVVLAKELAIDRKEVIGAAFFPDGWFILELGPNFQLRPLHYTLRNGGGTFAACMTGWVLEASQSLDGPWHTLDHKVFVNAAVTTDDDKFPHHSFSFPIPEGSKVQIESDEFLTPGHNNCGYR